jgi:predicted phosphodiesterase
MDHLLKTRENVLTIKPHPSNRYVVFSDFHRGVSDHADDFKPQNKESYINALSYYFNNHFSLIHLGDVEELKEQFLLGKVVDHGANQAILTSEKIFFNHNRLYKVFGNHDSQWENKKRVKEYLHPHFPNLKVYEGIILEYVDAPDIMLVHGHQGYSWIKTNIAEKLVLPFYKLGLNIFGLSRETNYEKYCKIEKTENEFYEWTKDQDDLILIFGHTHRPLWGSSTHIDNLEKELETKRKILEEIAIKNNVTVRQVVAKSNAFGALQLVDDMRKIMNKITEKRKESGTCRSPIPLPILFNTGCCIYHDGDITGMEIEDGHLRLIKWGKDDTGAIKRVVLESGALDSFTMPL